MDIFSALSKFTLLHTTLCYFSILILVKIAHFLFIRDSVLLKLQFSHSKRMQSFTISRVYFENLSGGIFFMSETTNVKEVKIATADPSAIGLFGLAIVTLVASTQKLGWTDGLGLVIPWAIFLGGIAQLYASMLDAKHNNTFGTTAFGAYGFFWLGVAMSWFMQAGVFGDKFVIDSNQMGVMYVGYLVLTIFLTIGALETNKVLFFIFFLIDFLFIGLAFSAFGIMEHGMHLLAAWAELFIAILSLYGAGANVLNKHFGFAFLPIGKPFGIIKKPSAKAATKTSRA